MRREAFEHVVRAAADIARDEIVVVGSQAILGQYPDAPDDLLVSLELDVYPRNHPERADLIDGALGDGSMFHATYGYYAHGVAPDTPVAPASWHDRLVRIDVVAVTRARGTATAWCMEAHDLVLAKLAAGRPHDLVFAAGVVRASLVHPERLHQLAATMPTSHRAVVRARLTRLLTA